MSQPETLGIVDAGRWAGVSAAIADYLERWLAGSAPSAPKGTFAGAERFLAQVLEGAALDRHDRPRPESPVMAGLSSWTLAMDVLTRLPGSGVARPEEVEKVIEQHLACLRQIKDGEQPSATLKASAESLKSFFFELLQQGSRKRQAVYAREEAPQG